MPVSGGITAGIAKRVHAHGLRHTHAAELRGEGFDIGGICITGFSVPHDASNPLGFVLEKDGVRIVIAPSSARMCC